MKRHFPFSISQFLFFAFVLAGCQSAEFQGIQDARVKMNDAIKSEPPGNYFIGRRYYKEDYKFWGFVRKPGEPWSAARLVMMNEQKKLAPDRAVGKLGSDHGYEYKLFGEFSGETVYEPASNGFYPEFVLTGSELRSTTPPPIFHTSAANNPTTRVIGQPY
jgi:hypothetical protein